MPVLGSCRCRKNQIPDYHGGGLDEIAFFLVSFPCDSIRLALLLRFACSIRCFIVILISLLSYWLYVIIKYVYTPSRASGQVQEGCFDIICSFRHSFDGTANLTTGDKSLTSSSLKSGSVIFSLMTPSAEWK
jgi:hypothetical protein